MKQLKEIYDGWSVDYDKNYKENPAAMAEKPYILKLLKPNKKDKVLDIGCGTGIWMNKLAPDVKSVLGVDVSKGMLEIAKQKTAKHKNVELIYSKFPTSKLKGKKFDKILSSLVLNHIRDIDGFFREVNKLLKKGGRIVFSDFAGGISKVEDPFIPIYVSKDKTKADQRWNSILHKHHLLDYIEVATKYNFKMEKIIPVKVNKKLGKTITPQSYKKNKGRVLLAVFSFTK